MIIGIGGSRVSRATLVAGAVAAYSDMVPAGFSFLECAQNRTVTAAYDTAQMVQRLHALRESSPASAPQQHVVALGPTCADPSVQHMCDLLVYLDLDERLSMVRWADELLQDGTPGGIEALEIYSTRIAPAEAEWVGGVRSQADLVLADEGSPDKIAAKIVYLFGHTGLPAGARPQEDGSPATSHSAPRPQPQRVSTEDISSLATHIEKRLSEPRHSSLVRTRLRRFRVNVLYPQIKRALDIFIVSLVLFVAWPILLLVAMLVWIHDPGPVLYVQTRVGRWGRTIAFPKFRTMVQNADKLKDRLLAQNEMQGGITFKMKRDPRVLPIGRTLRRYSLDELPQLWSVLRGDLSLVGPRPPVPGEVALYTARDRRRLEVVPGLTCIWQVSGRSDIPFPRQVELDVEYIEKRNLLLDTRLLLATIPAVLTGRGAY